MNDEKWVPIIECEFRPRCTSRCRHGNGREDAKERLRVINGEVLIAPSGRNNARDGKNANEGAHET